MAKPVRLAVRNFLAVSIMDEPEETIYIMPAIVIAVRAAMINTPVPQSTRFLKPVIRWQSVQGVVAVPQGTIPAKAGWLKSKKRNKRDEC